MRQEILIAVVKSVIDKTLRDIEFREGPRGPRGFSGRDGNNFSLEEHLPLILKAIPPFELTDQMKSELKGDTGPIGPQGERGPRGHNGLDGNDFQLSEHIDSIIQALPPIKLSEEEKEELRGPRGFSGKDFSFEDSKEEINKIVSKYILENSSIFKLKLSDLDSEEIERLRGPKGARGQRGSKGDKGEDGKDGKDGKSFSFEDEVSNISELLLSHKEELRLQFSHLTKEEISSLKLKFSDLDKEDIEKLRGPRGQRGKEGEKGEQGLVGPKGETGERGPRGQRGKVGDTGEQGPRGETGERGPRGIQGLPGATGPRGIQGISGKDGKDGKDGIDAPVVEDIEIDKRGDKISLIFYFDDGSKIETNQVKLPKASGGGGMPLGGGGGGGSTSPSSSQVNVLKDGVALGPALNLDFTGDNFSLVYDSNTKTVIIAEAEEHSISIDGNDSSNLVFGPEFTTSYDSGTRTTTVNSPNNCVLVADEGNQVTDCLKSINFIGDLVEVTSSTMMSDWPTLSDVEPSIGTYEAANPGQVTVKITQPDAANVVIKDVVCDTTVYVGALVRMTNVGTAINALADNTTNSNVLGVVEAKSSTVLCNVRVLGVTADIFTGLDVTKEYYLSDTIPGGLSTTIPTASGSVKLKIGQPFSDKKLLILKGERTVRA